MSSQSKSASIREGVINVPSAVIWRPRPAAVDGGVKLSGAWNLEAVVVVFEENSRLK